MDNKTLYRILSGKIIVNIGHIYVINPVKYEHKYMAEEIYEETLIECLQDNVLSREDKAFELMLFRLKLPFNYKVTLKESKTAIDDKKVELYEAVKERKESDKIRQEIKDLDNTVMSILSKLHCMDTITAEGIAELAKTRYLIKKGLGRKVSAETIENIMNWISRNTITERTYRQIARSGIFFNIVSAANSNIFDNYPLTDEQISLMYWYKFYKNVYESQDKPFDWVIEDDLALDGWYILQARKSAKVDSVNYVESKIHSDAVRNSQEVYVIGGSKMNSVVYNANDEGGKAYIKAKQSLVNKGKLNESTERSLGQGFGVK